MAVKVRRDLVDEAQELGIPKNLAGDLGPVFQNIQRVVEHPEIVDEIGPNTQIVQQLHAGLDLTLEAGYSVVGKNRDRSCPAVEELGQFCINVEERALYVLTVVLLQRLIQMASHADIIDDVAARLCPGRPVHPGDRL